MGLNATDTGNWSYSSTVFVSSHGAMGRPAGLDVDGDGIAELFLPRPSEGMLEIYGFGGLTAVTGRGLCWDCLNQNGRCPCCCADAWACLRTSLISELAGNCQGGCGHCRGKDFLQQELCGCAFQEG